MKILIIEDDAGIAELMRSTLEELNYQVTCVETFEDADRFLQHEKPILMIVDYSISNTNAMNWLSSRKNSQHSVPPFIMSTGQGDERIAVNMMKLGARDYIIKDSHFFEMIPLVVRRVCTEIEKELKLKFAEQALHESENRYKNLFQKSLSVMLLIHPDTGEIKDANPAACTYYGWAYTELCGKNISEINGLTVEDSKKELQNAKNEKHNYLVFEHRLANGEKRNVEVYSTPINFDRTTMLYSIVQDITERRKAEEELLLKIDELERFQNLTVGRELTMIELKKEVNEMLNLMGRKEKYKIVE